jgi:hypothetical protein
MLIYVQISGLESPLHTQSVSAGDVNKTLKGDGLGRCFTRRPDMNFTSAGHSVCLCWAANRPFMTSRKGFISVVVREAILFDPDDTVVFSNHVYILSKNQY